MLRIAVKLYSSIDPSTEILVVGFLGYQDRRKWIYMELPSKLDALAASLGLSEISVRPEPCEIVGDMPSHHVLPDDVVQIISRQYHDLYAAH
jgi:hypothetical protein